MGFRYATCRVAMLAGAAAALAACASTEIAQPAPSAGLQCVDDSAQCIGKRQADLKAMMDDKSRSWVRQPADAKAYASGVRLFAYRGKRKELSCDELAHGKREADGAPVALKGPGAAGLTPAQVSRGSMLAAEVSRELGVEMTRRCRRA
jgi:hypothetical protein